MPFLAFLVTVTFIPGLPSAATVPRWALLASVIPFFWYFSQNTKITAGHILGFVFIAWATLSLAWAFNFEDGVYDLGKLVLLALVFCVGAARQDLRAVYIGLGLGVGVNSAIVVAQWYGWDVLPQMVAPGGLFYNKNFVAELAAMVLVALVFERIWWLVPATFPAIVLCHSRGSEMALAFAAIVLIYQHKKWLAAVVFGCFVAAGSYLWITNDSAAQRLLLWHDTVDGLRFWGRGIGSFFVTFPEHATRIDALALRPSEVHNDLLQLVFELGPGALAAVALLVFALRSKPLRAEHYVVVVFLVEGLVGFPLYMPATAFLAALALGALCGRGPDVRSALARFGVRVLYGVQNVGHARHRDAPSFARADAVPLRTTHPFGASLFLHRFPLLRSSRRRYPSHFRGITGQPFCG